MPLLALLLALALPARAATHHAAIPTADRFFTTSDGARLHYTESGPRAARTLVLIPGWTMPAWIFSAQIAAFSHRYHVIAFDPRGQGFSEVAPGGYTLTRRAADIAQLLARIDQRPVVLLGWSLGVLDILAYLHRDGDARVAGLVLVDNSVGEYPPPRPSPPGPRYRRPPPWPVRMRAFVRGMFHTHQSPAYLERLTNATLRLPQPDALRLLAYPVPRSYWRQAIYATTRPVLYLVRPGLSGQAHNLAAHRPDTRIAIFPHAGHAMFVDDPARFDHLVGDFLGHTLK